MKVSAFLLIHNYNFIQIAEAERFTNFLEMNTFPINLFLDRNGKVARVQGGIPYVQDKDNKTVMDDGKAFEEILRKLLQEK